jgi:hypothetical protein
MLIFTVLFFFICRRKQCRFYSYFSSLFAAEIFVDSNLIFLLFLRRKSFSIWTVFFSFICPGNPNLIVPHRCRGCLFFYCTTRAASPWLLHRGWCRRHRHSGFQHLSPVWYQSIPVPDWASLFRYRAGSSICILVHSGTRMNRCRTVWRSRIKTVWRWKKKHPARLHSWIMDSDPVPDPDPYILSKIWRFDNIFFFIGHKNVCAEHKLFV